MKLYFTASWCGPCQSMKPIMKELVPKYNIKVIDVDTDAEMTSKYGIRSIPTFINEKGDRKLGAQSKSALESFFAT